MDKTFKKEHFQTLKIKRSVANKFRKFSKTLSQSQSMTLLLMLDFFKDNSISPYESLGVNMTTLEGSIKKRINALIAIVKDIEKTHHKPTTAILQTLFEETSNIEKEEDEFNFETPKLTTENEELTYFRNAYYTKQENYNVLKYDIEEIIKKITYIKRNFGKGHFRLDITKEEFENLKLKLENVPQ